MTVTGRVNSDAPRIAGAFSMPGRRWVVLVAIIALALAARLFFWWVQARSGAVPPGDPEEYYRAAVHLLQGGYHDTGKWLRPPVYPALLAALLPLAGMNVAGALLLQAIALSAGVLVFYAFGAQLFGRPAVGLLAALLAALFIPLASYASSLYAEALFTIVLIAGLAAFDRALSGGARMAFGAGMLLALAALTRAVGLYLIPLLALWAVWLAWHDMAARGRYARVIVALALGALLVIGPWAARNYLVHGRVILSDTNGGVSMWFGAVRDDAELAAGNALLAATPNLADRQSLALRMTWDIIQDDPPRFLTRIRFKIASLYGLQTRSYAVGDIISIDPRGAPLVQNAGEYSLPLMVLADAQYLAVTLLAIGGICFMPRRDRAAPVLLWVALATMLAALTIGHPRLRLPIIAAFLPFAAYALTLLPGVWSRLAALRRDRRAYAALAVALLFLALTASTRYLPWLASLPDAVAGRAALARGDIARAELLLTRARAADPANPLRTIDLGDAALARGQDAVALAFYQQAAAMEHRSLYAQALRAAVATRLNLAEEAAAGLAEIDSYWRSGNDLLEWSWAALDPAPAARVIPGDPAALGQAAGFAPATPDLPVGRWTLGEGRVRVRGGCGTLAVRLSGPAGRVVEIMVDDWGLRERVTLNGAPQEARLSLQSIRECEYQPALTVRISSATGLLDLEQAPWYGGAAVHEVRVDP